MTSDDAKQERKRNQEGDEDQPHAAARRSTRFRLFSLSHVRHRRAIPQRLRLGLYA